MEALDIRPNLLNIESSYTHPQVPLGLLTPIIAQLFESTIFLPIHTAELCHDPHHPIIWIPLNQQGMSYKTPLCATEALLLFY